ncbi:hypothetical protein ASPBRDRAFT_46093 [Aspergillus brasiliensis CBS 101740]|uniref:Uncharacterized protein n=1 Tax=Aspergillus brasiliensis (strain CBS 101740 / IMI 381727 / IBT 21946) TaxID=767769 RepID=A0A1L9UAW2_ASPBC|nr:hypothetical protein ASPBRDRAFT_46093 [Aspergillus brasiliensis CBS 101740]
MLCTSLCCLDCLVAPSHQLVQLLSSNKAQRSEEPIVSGSMSVTAAVWDNCDPLVAPDGSTQSSKHCCSAFNAIAPLMPLSLATSLVGTSFA